MSPPTVSSGPPVRPPGGAASRTPRRLRILITDAQELAGLGAIRSLGRAGHHVTAAYPDGLARPAGACSRYCAATLTYPDAWRRHAAFHGWLRATSGAFDVILPISEAAIVASVALQEDLPGPLWLVPSDGSLRYTLSKYHATQAAQRLGLRTPRTLFLEQGQDPLHDGGGPSRPGGAGWRLEGLRFPLSSRPTTIWARTARTGRAAASR